MNNEVFARQAEMIRRFHQAPADCAVPCFSSAPWDEHVMARQARRLRQAWSLISIAQYFYLEFRPFMIFSAQILFLSNGLLALPITSASEKETRDKFHSILSIWMITFTSYFWNGSNLFPLLWQGSLKDDKPNLNDTKCTCSHDTTLDWCKYLIQCIYTALLCKHFFSLYLQL